MFIKHPEPALSTQNQALAAAVLTLSLAFGQVFGGVYKPASEDLECAISIGVDLRTPTDPASPTVMRRLGWNAALVLIGQVSRVFHESDGPYGTTVEMKIESVLAGHTDYQFVYIDLRAIPTGDGGGLRAAEEYKFTVGESLLVFLNSDYPETPERPEHWIHQEGHYSISAQGKFRIEGDEVIAAGLSAEAFPLAWVREEIAVARGVRRQGCAID